MAQIGAYLQLAHKFTGLAEFAFVYISEAHPVDGWKIENNPNMIHRHRSTSERVRAATRWRDSLPCELGPCPVYVDGIDNTVSLNFEARPDRLAVLRQGELVFLGGHGPSKYSVAAVDKWLQANLEKTHFTTAALQT